MIIAEQPVNVAVITGPVGAGKSTVAAALADHLASVDHPHALVDQDYLRWIHPQPVNDPFSAQLGLRNLGAIWPNFTATGIRTLILADVVENRSQIVEYQEAMPGSTVTVVRLNVPMSIIMRRLLGRESPETIDWYRRRAPELQMIMEQGEVEDVLINVGERTPAAVALEIGERLRLAGCTACETGRSAVRDSLAEWHP